MDDLQAISRRLGEQVRDAYSVQGLSAAEVARRAGHSHTAVSLLEGGRATPRITPVTVAIVRAIEPDPYHLLTDKLVYIATVAAWEAFGRHNPLLRHVLLAADLAAAPLSERGTSGLCQYLIVLAREEAPGRIPRA